MDDDYHSLISSPNLKREITGSEENLNPKNVEPGYRVSIRGG